MQLVKTKRIAQQKRKASTALHVRHSLWWVVKAYVRWKKGRKIIKFYSFHFYCIKVENCLQHTHTVVERIDKYFYYLRVYWIFIWIHKIHKTREMKRKCNKNDISTAVNKLWMVMSNWIYRAKIYIF